METENWSIQGEKGDKVNFAFNNLAYSFDTYSEFSLSGSNRLNLLPQATVLRTSYRLQPLEGSLKLYKLF